MASNLQTPGVYRQDVFLRAPVELPTGIPAFVGFAAAAARLDYLPPLVFPERLRSRLSYDAGRRRLTFEGNLSEADAAELASLSADRPFREAVRALARNAQAVVALHRREELFDNFSPPAGGLLAEAVAGFFQNGGVRCYVARAVPSETLAGRVRALKNALDALAPLNDLDLVAVPDAMLLNISTGDASKDAANLAPDVPAILDVQAYALRHCAEHVGRFAILASLRGGSADDVARQREGLALRADETVSGALYFPWLRTRAGGLVPPCGHVAGIYARTDRKVGVFKAPANEEVFGVVDLEPRVTAETQGALNPLGVNCLRAFAGRGIRVWGARTLSRDENWRYVNVRRLFLTVCRWVDLNMPWATYEPNEPRLWVRIQRELGAYLRGLWVKGALVGQTPDQAFYVKCDAETNPPESREAGRAVTEVGIAPSAPAEFVVVRILHRAGTTEAQ
ncbi:MAG TPA: phage tail sheath subtilisin-like domain-containing protein [Pyrinomonadaceae bacterium]|nr:phage tail sheath subtilisin-like domain-containing protein [Pyrinomonadaceae bacterium]